MRRLYRLLSRLAPDGRGVWCDVGSVDEFPAETVRAVIVRGTPVAVFHTCDELLAIGNVCPHMGASLSEGAVERDAVVTCPAHALSFDLRTGKCRQDRNYAARPFPTRVEHGRVLVFA